MRSAGSPSWLAQDNTHGNTDADTFELGNLLIRPAPSSSKSPYNFEIVLLDHGLYFDLDQELRINYAKLWLALIAPGSEATRAARRKYAKLVGNVDDDLVSDVVAVSIWCSLRLDLSIPYLSPQSLVSYTKL